MVDDDIMPLNPLIAPVEEEEFEETSFDVNASQRSRDEKPFQSVVRTWVEHSTWDRWLSPNPHTLMIYLEFVPSCGSALERFEKCQCENDDVCLHYRTWVPDNDYYC